MENLFYAGIIVILTGIAGIAIGLYDFFTKKNKAYGFGNKKPFIEVQDVGAFNKSVGKLWMVTGLCICLDGALLLLPNPENRAFLVGISAIAIYTCSSIFYVIVIENKYRKENEHDR